MRKWRGGGPRPARAPLLLPSRRGTPGRRRRTLEFRPQRNRFPAGSDFCCRSPPAGLRMQRRGPRRRGGRSRRCRSRRQSGGRANHEREMRGSRPEVTEPGGRAGGWSARKTTARRACRRVVGRLAAPTHGRPRSPLLLRQGPAFSRDGSSSSRCGSHRPRRSRRQTTRVSPGRRWSSRRVSWGRASSAPLAVSLNPRAQPAAVSASCGSARPCSLVETRA